MKVCINDFEMYYEISGNDSKEWLILLHGISGSTRCWKNQIDDFDKHFKVLNVDLAGHGNSTTPASEKYNGALVANHIRILMDRLSIKKAYFLGLSLGTIIQQYFCELFPERVIAMIYASPITKPNYLTKISNGFADKIFLKVFSKNAYLKIMANLMMPGKAHEKSRKFFLQETFKMSEIEFRKWWKVVVQGDHFFFLNKNKIPALIIVGEKDFCFFNDALLLKDKCMNSEFKVIKGAGHVTVFQKPEEFNSTVIEYSIKLDTKNMEEIEKESETMEKDKSVKIA